MTLMNQNLMKLLKVHNINNVIFYIVIMSVTFSYITYLNIYYINEFKLHFIHYFAFGNHLIIIDLKNIYLNIKT